jgi:hypothetical protein
MHFLTFVTGFIFGHFFKEAFVWHFFESTMSQTAKECLRLLPLFYVAVYTFLGKGQ